MNINKKRYEKNSYTLTDDVDGAGIMGCQGTERTG